MDYKSWLAVLALLLCSARCLYCSSPCIDYTGPCRNETQLGCIVCATSLFAMLPDPSLPFPCALNPQTLLLANELGNDAMSLFGYSTSSPVPLVCNNYTFSGQYAAGDYLFKNFTGIPINHYALVVRFNVGFMGSWSSSDGLRLRLEDDEQTIDFDYNYGCSIVENICNEAYPTSDCIRIKEKTLAHNATFLALNFSARTTQTDPNLQSWGIKDLLLAAKMCHSACDLCFGPANSDCLSCALGFYLQGNVCLPACDLGYYKVDDQRLCVKTCPAGYYLDAPSKSCLHCAPGCLVCANAQLCQAWEDQPAKVDNNWTDKMEFWILLIVIAVLVVAYVAYRIAKKCCRQEEEETSAKEEESGQEASEKASEGGKAKAGSREDSEADLGRASTFKSEAKLMSAESVESAGDVDYPAQTVQPEDSLWFNELVEIDPADVRVAKTRRRRKAKKQEEDDKPSEFSIKESHAQA
jgi:hypothetical protein